MPSDQPLAEFTAAYAPDDAALAAELLTSAALPPDREARIDAVATELISSIRGSEHGLGGVDAMLREFALSTKEGLALMVLAEALLRVPDAATADAFIEDKLDQGDFAHHRIKSDAVLVNASAWALGLSARLVHAGETPQGTLAALTRRIGAPAVRAATRQAMRLIGNHFVLGETIDSALARAKAHVREGSRYSYDMLGEGARTAEDAERYYQSYSDAITAIGRTSGNAALPARPGISVKLSALHPRFEAISRDRVMRELTPRLLELARLARSHDLAFTVDAEEADRLELSLEVFAACFADPSLSGWDGYGLAVQAYQKRAAAVIDYVAELANALDRRIMLRLVKGAYWDTEIKRAQERGLVDYPVFTGKPMTDLNYLSCAGKLLSLRPRLFPQFASHNALTVATILELADGSEGYEFQRLHGMGEALYARLLAEHPQAVCRIYAPVGGHRDLLAYLVRRLLENGANSSFVAQAGDENVSIAELLTRPAALIGRPEDARNPVIPLPRDLYRPLRINSRGIEFGDRAALTSLLDEIDSARSPLPTVVSATKEHAAATITAAHAGFVSWSRTSAGHRATILERAGDLLEQRRAAVIALLQDEGRKTLDDCVAEVREAVDYCRYYASEGRRLFEEPVTLPGPTGERNTLTLRGRGVFVAISPWNFPLAILLGQITAALMAGNAVVAKPAEQTPVIAELAIRLLHEAGVPRAALHLVQGDGRIGAVLVEQPDVAGVAFTGSTEVARAINRTLAAKGGPIVTLIAETGGINAMIVDATALPEQVADDVVTSAFRSAGQRCSALRLLCVQGDVADRVIAMIAGAARELKIGDPRDPSTHVGPVIDAAAKAKLDAHIAKMKRKARLHFAGTAPASDNFVAPHVFELSRTSQLTEEVFGPILHVVRYKAAQFDELLDDLAATGYALTLGVQSRIDDTVARVIARLPTGNVYVNRNIIGAVVGVQPFGGSGLSGTGPKAGGPHYLPCFALEQTVSINTAAAGGNAALLTGGG